MDFSISSELQATLDTVRAFVHGELVPLEQEFLHRPFVQLLPMLHKKRKKVQELGLFAPHIGREHGGAGLACSPSP